MAALRMILLKTKLEENFKWNLPCYTYQGQNIVIVQPFKSYLGLMFFKVSLLKDSKNVLVNNGPNSQAARRFEFQSVLDIARLKMTIKAYIQEAIAIEESGKKVVFKKSLQALPEELKKVFSKNTRVKKAFDSLTPGRQRSFLIHLSSAKQPSTRRSRIEKCIPQILAGKGLDGR